MFLLERGRVARETLVFMQRGIYATRDLVSKALV